MKVHELIRAAASTMEALNIAAVKMEDVSKLALYDEYSRLCAAGYKKAYIVMRLSEQYKISERQIYLTVKKLEKDIKYECQRQS